MGSEAQKLWVTQREAVTAKFDGDGKPYTVSTKPLFCTLSLVADVVYPATPATVKYAFAVFRKQTLDFFSYGLGDRIDIGADNRQATPADTNLSKAKQTNGAALYVIEGLSLHSRGMYAKDGGTDAAADLTPFPTSTDPDVKAAIEGKRLVADPGSIFLVPQQYSPFNLENALLQAVLGQTSLEISWDQKRFERIGTAMYTPQGGGGSELRSNGMPLASNVARVVEGYLWSKAGTSDSELTVAAVLQQAVVVPITLNDDPSNDGDEVCGPSKLYMDMVLKLHGFEFKYPSGN